MKNLFLNTQLLIYSPLFFLLVNISDGKVSAPEVKKHFSVTQTASPSKLCEDCRADLEAWNAELKEDEDGFIDKDEVNDYMKCLESLIPNLDYVHNMRDYYFLLDCLTNLMDYYDFVEHNEDALNDIEDLIYDISYQED